MPTNEPWIIYALAFGAVLLGVQGLFLFLSLRHREQKAINRRLVLGQRLGSPTEVLDTLRHERGLGSTGGVRALAGFETLVLQTGLRIDPIRLLIMVLGLAALLALVFSFAFGVGIIAVALALFVSLAGIYLVLQLLRRRRIERFGAQFSDALQVMVRGLRAGHPFRVALALVAREMPDPIGSEFGILVDEITFGLDLNTAVDNVVRRVGHDDLAFFAVAVNIQSQTGGNLGEILSRLAELIRNRAKLRLKVRAMTAEGRLSAVFLTLAPFILFAVISLISPSYFADIRHHPVLIPAITVGFLLLAIGNFIMYRMVNFKV
jgi:tight adherence protein B